MLGMRKGHHEHGNEGQLRAQNHSTTIDPICGMTVDPDNPKGGSAQHAGRTYYFCSAGCRTQFLKDPARFASPRESLVDIPTSSIVMPKTSAAVEYTCPMHPEIVRNAPGSCPICGMALERRTVTGDEQDNPELIDMTRRFWVGLVLTIPVFVMAMGEMLQGPRCNGSSPLRCKRGRRCCLQHRSCSGRDGPFLSGCGPRSSTSARTCSL
jgi:Cu+-exporting ATPase